MIPRCIIILLLALLSGCGEKTGRIKRCDDPRGRCTCFYDRATWYGEPYRGKVMANGRPFNPDALTAASWNYPLGSKLRLVYGNKSVVVEVTDRGGARAHLQFGKVVDLSHAAFARLERPAVGSIRVRIKRMEQVKRAG